MMSLFKHKIILLVFMLSVFNTYATIHFVFPKDSTTQKKDSLKPSRFKAFGIPVFFYLPETKFGGGAAGITTFRFKKDSSIARPSTVQFVFALTQLKQQLIYLSYQLWMKNDTYNVFGELGYYKYNYFFWGIGNKQSSDLKELYGVTYPRLKLNALKRFAPFTYGGLKYNYDGYQVTSVDTNGILKNGNIIGSKGGTVSSLGIVAKYDNRDNLFSPTRGYFAELYWQIDDKLIGSSFNNTRIGLDASTYITTKFKHTIAFNLYTVFGNGSIPFNQMALLGGAKKMRGYYEGRYRDNNLMLFQTEYRAPLFWRLGAVAFIGVGDVFDTFKNIEIPNFKLAYGTGIRVLIDKKQKINARLDVGWAEPKPNFYLTLTEAF